MIKLYKIIYLYVLDYFIDLLFFYNWNFLGGLNLILVGFGFFFKDQVYVGGKVCFILLSFIIQIVCFIFFFVSII